MDHRRIYLLNINVLASSEAELQSYITTKFEIPSTIQTNSVRNNVS